MSTGLRQHLVRTVTRKLDAHGIVVWEDPRGEYAGVAEEVCPPETGFARWDGSWYRLRGELEAMVDGPEPPRLLVYQPVATPEEDPLAEIRAAGRAWHQPLSRLVRDALAGTLTGDRIAELARQSRTLAEVEATLTGGSGIGVRLPAALGSADTIELALRVLADDRGDFLANEELWDEAADLLSRAFGVPPGVTDADLSDIAFRHLVLIELTAATGAPPPGLEQAVTPTTPEQRRRAGELLGAWRRDRLRVGYLPRARRRRSARTRPRAGAHLAPGSGPPRHRRGHRRAGPGRGGAPPRLW